MSDKKWERVDKAFDFFTKRNAEDRAFTLEELAGFTQWNIATAKTYITKRWNSFLVREGATYKCNKQFAVFDRNTFRQHHSQKDTVEKFFYQLLVEKSVLACVSAIEIYNKPDFKFREESFSILMVNAWELLLKAKILQENSDDIRSIQVKERDGTIAKNRSGNEKTIPVNKAIGILDIIPIKSKASRGKRRDGSCGGNKQSP